VGGIKGALASCAIAPLTDLIEREGEEELTADFILKAVQAYKQIS